MKFWNTNLLESPRNGEVFYTYHPYIPQIARAHFVETRNINGLLEINPKIDGYNPEDYKIYAWSKSKLDLNDPEVLIELDKVYYEYGKTRDEEVQVLCKYIEEI